MVVGLGTAAENELRLIAGLVVHGTEPRHRDDNIAVLHNDSNVVRLPQGERPSSGCRLTMRLQHCYGCCGCGGLGCCEGVCCGEWIRLLTASAEDTPTENGEDTAGWMTTAATTIICSRDMCYLTLSPSSLGPQSAKRKPGAGGVALRSPPLSHALMPWRRTLLA